MKTPFQDYVDDHNNFVMFLSKMGGTYQLKTNRWMFGRFYVCLFWSATKKSFIFHVYVKNGLVYATKFNSSEYLRKMIHKLVNLKSYEPISVR